MSADLSEQFMAKVEKAPDGCWLWTGAVARNGYGQVGISGRTRSAHRVAYETAIGPVPEGLVLDHLCRVRNCVNPWHMEPVTRGVNVLRGVSKPALRRRSGTCDRGHAMTPENSRPNGPGSRVCRICRRASQRAAYARTRAAQAA